MDFQEYIKQKKEEYSDLINFLEFENDNEVHFNSFKDAVSQKIKNLPPKEKQNEIKLLLRLLSSIGCNHYHNANFLEKIEKIINFFKDEIKQTLTNLEIFDTFKNNKQILLFLFKNQIIQINNELIKDAICITPTYLPFFYPEIKEQISEEERKQIENNLLSDDPSIFTNFDDKRQKAENDTYICQLIRQDSIEDFKSYVSQNNIPLDSNIKKSIFETNRFLLSKDSVSLIEYAAFYGSIQIFNFLREKSVVLTPSLWLYSIHGQKIELIQILKESQIEPEDKTFCECFVEAIKCHHNQIASFIKENLLTQKDEIECIEKVVEASFHYCNYSYFPEDLNQNPSSFFFSCKYDYQMLLEFLLQMKKDYIESKVKI